MVDTRLVAVGGKSIYGVPLGVLMLETRFPRILGDMGNGQTWPFPVLYRVIKGANPKRVVLDGAEGLLQDFINAAQELVSDGAEAITTTCGFLSLFQAELAAAVNVPVATSSLMQVPWVKATLPPGRKVGIVTISGPSLSQAHLCAAGVAIDTPVIGVENGRELFRVIVKEEKSELDISLASADVVNAALELRNREPTLGAIVLECTNMPPYAAAVQRAIGLPVFDIYTMINWFHSGIRPRQFD